MAYAFFSKCPKIEDVHFLFQNQMGKMGHFKKKSSIKKWGISKKKARDQFKSRKWAEKEVRADFRLDSQEKRKIKIFQKFLTEIVTSQKWTRKIPFSVSGDNRFLRVLGELWKLILTNMVNNDHIRLSQKYQPSGCEWTGKYREICALRTS